MAKSIIYLTPPLLHDCHIKEKIVCIRAHRERLFNVSAQKINEKLIFHNYGHGGAGWTFLFGCVHESLRQFEQQLLCNERLKKNRVAIIGAGCYGLLTALYLARKGYAVRIIAKDIDNIPSYKAAGFFFPRPRKCSTPQETTVFHSLGMESYATYLAIATGTHPFIGTGAQLLPAYFGTDIEPGFGPYLAHKLIGAPKQVRIDFNTGKIYAAMAYTTVFIDAAAIMQELWRLVKELEIPVIRTEIATFDDIEESIIFNCAGLGAKKLTADPRIVPVQGHLIMLQNQPDISVLHYMINVKVIQKGPKGMRDELIYFAPKDEGILGITFIRGQDSPTANHHEFDRLLERCKTFFGT